MSFNEGTTSETCERFIERGFSKLVVLPAFPVADWTEELEVLASRVLPLTT